MLPYLIREGDHVVDVGASIGIYTKKLAQLVGHAGCVHSIEPIPEVFKILSANVQVFRLENVRGYNCCISDDSGMATMEIPIDQRGIENHYLARIVSSSANQGFSQIQIPTKTLDELFSEAETRISFIKIDTEGHELSCIRGAEGIIRKFMPSLLIEISGEPDVIESEAFHLFAFLNKLGYEPYFFNGINLCRRVVHLDRSTNYFFLGSRHTGILREQGILSS